MELTWAPSMCVITSPSWRPQALAGEAKPSWVVTSDSPTTNTPWENSLIPTAWPSGITYWVSPAALALGERERAVIKATAHTSRQRKPWARAAGPWHSLVCCKRSPPFLVFLSVRGKTRSSSMASFRKKRSANLTQRFLGIF